MGEVEDAVKDTLEHSGDSPLNSIIAILVALAATFMALGNVKDGNVTQAMSQAQAEAVDAWSYYQAKSTKQNLAEATRDQLKALRLVAPAGSPALADLDQRIKDYETQVARYEKEKAEVKAQAEGFQKQYNDLNVHDDQFDLSEAGYSVAIALLGVTALTRKRWLLGVAAVFLAIGVAFELAGFLGWSLHPDKIMSLLS